MFLEVGPNYLDNPFDTKDFFSNFKIEPTNVKLHIYLNIKYLAMLISRPSFIL